MKKKILGLIIMMMLCFGMTIPVAADVVLPDSFSISSYEMEGYSSCWSVDGFLYEDYSGEGWSYDSDTRTFTFSGVNASYFGIDGATDDVSIVLEENTVNTIYHMGLGTGETDNGNLTSSIPIEYFVSGNGTLDVGEILLGVEYGYDYNVEASLILNSGTVNVTNIKSPWSSRTSDGKLSGNLTINGGLLTACYWEGSYENGFVLNGGKIKIDNSETDATEPQEISAICSYSSGNGERVKEPSQNWDNYVFVNKDGEELHFEHGEDKYGHYYYLCNPDGTPATYACLQIQKFSDVKEGQFYYEPVNWAVKKEITTGMSSSIFAPEESCSRGQIVTFLYRAMGKPEVSNTKTNFTDISKGQYYYDAVLWATENGITNGLTADTFGPEESCSRGQIVTFLHRAMKTPEVTTAETSFTDISKDQYYYDAVLWAVENKITNGLNATSFAPDDTCTRGQIVTFLYRTLGE